MNKIFIELVSRLKAETPKVWNWVFKIVAALGGAAGAFLLAITTTGYQDKVPEDLIKAMVILVGIAAAISFLAKAQVTQDYHDTKKS